MRQLSLALLAAALLTAQTHSLEVTVKGFKSEKGMAAVAVFKDASSFPTKAEKAVAMLRVPISGGIATAKFDGLSPGTYAVAAYHDLNNNSKLDANFIGIPKEPVAASKDAKGRMGPPAFKDASFEIPATTSLIVNLQ